MAKPKARHHAKKAFILEPILTPSSVVDTSMDDASQVFDQEWLAMIDSKLDPLNRHFEFPDDPESVNEIVDFTTQSDAVDPEIAMDGELSSDPIEQDRWHEFDEYDYFEEPDFPPPDVPLIPEDIQFTSGVFTVGESGEVGIDYLFDGGKYDRGELAIFSLEGMESEPGTREFIQEAASRALSNSEWGYVVISDATDAARFSNTGGVDFNAGEYQQVQTFQMRAGDRFGFMLVPNQSIEEAAAGRAWGTVFSMATDNPDDYFQFGQIADVTGDGNTFTLEDISLAGGKSDRDYNDIIFQVRGATADVPLMDDVLGVDRDWRTSPMGQALVNYAQAYTEQVDYSPEAFNVAREFQPLVGVIDTGFAADNPTLDNNTIITGTDFIDWDDNPFLTEGEGDRHGTQVVNVIDGMNDEAPLWLGRAVGSGRWADSLVEFVDAAVESGQPNAVVNLSLDLTQIDADGNVTTRYEFTPMEMAALEYARQNNVLVAAASGNQAGLMSALGQASMQFDNIITVGAAEQFDPAASNWQGYDRADYSSYGAGLDIVANGGTPENPIGGSYGSSMATAQVTGAISQIWAANPDLSYQQVIQILKQTATDLGQTGFDLATGTGLLNVAAAVHLAKATKAEDYETGLKSLPLTWSGQDEFTPLERAANPDTGSTGLLSTLGTSLSAFLGVFQPISTRFTNFLADVHAQYQGDPSSWFFQTHRGMDNRIYTRFYNPATGKWSSWEKGTQSNEATYHQPSVATLNGIVYQTHVGKDNKIYNRSSTDGVNWTAWTHANFPGEWTDHAVAMTTFNGKLYQTHVGGGNFRIYTRSSTDGVNWTGWSYPQGAAEKTNHPVAMTTLNGKLYQSYVGLDQKVYMRSSTDGLNWTAWERPNLLNEKANSAVAMVAFNGQLYQSHIGLDKKVYTRSSTDGKNWTTWKQENVRNEAAFNDPVLAVFDGKLYQYHVGGEQRPLPGGVMHSRYLQSDGTWSGWEKMDGARTPIKTIQKPVTVSTKWQNPLPGYRITSGYGLRRDPFTGVLKFHYGIDIGTSGTKPPVKAAQSGKVVSAGWNNSGYGNLVIIEHPGGIRTYYAHLSSIAVKTGQQVTSGAKIGNVGSTGNSTGNHLHIEVRVSPYRHKTDNRNPKNYIPF
ncbi:peptidoglycan DD-metalloendopeptidase family protein [Spirulina sp. CCNP1310]|uniref:peptidoglycan DD-metalloendopeptidase family protein n=1 Tax=Spirulina sp. CCNP1310 TaxID=3110249 RepID=UPI002B201F3C|nr:peptidoglycan DD-metalloendopeptidase family protein [Spirulina sp. CCNP1310]MEA5417832.1 peptidoglycan DD-metalloendopeptidase family protein [Spirulina sp. CCNP1310]